MPEPGQKEIDSRIGSLAVREGHITGAELEAALIRQRQLSTRQEYRPLGAILVELGKLTPEVLDKLLNEQTESWGGQRRLDQYRLLEKIGEGGMGAVWKAVHVDLGNIVAIKLLPHAVVGDLALVDRFRHEARLMATVNHTNIVQAFDAGDDRGQPYFVMPYLDGASLGQILKKCGRLGVRTTLSIALQIVRGLRYAHERGMIHRDLKPDNLFLTHDGTVKILDLGLAKLMEGGPESRKSTQTGLTVGTPQYMSPEQVMGDPTIDGRSDIYSLGATLYQLLTGKVPFPGKNAPEVVRNKMDHPPPSLRAAWPEAPAGVDKLLESMLARRAASRPATCATLEAEIEALLDGQAITGSSLAPESVVLGRSEQPARTYDLTSPHRPRPVGNTAVRVPNRLGVQNATVTMVLPRRHRDPSSAQEPAAPLPSPPPQPESAVHNDPSTNLVVKLSMPTAQFIRKPAYQEETPATEELARVKVGWVGQLIAAAVLVILTIIVTLAVVKMQAGERRTPPAKTEAPR